MESAPARRRASRRVTDSKESASVAVDARAVIRRKSAARGGAKPQTAGGAAVAVPSAAALDKSAAASLYVYR
jgi:hypothetical protein